MFDHDEKIKRIVPPLDLCEKIPAGAFEDSVYGWCLIDGQPVVGIRQSWGFQGRLLAYAPTLQEIMDELLLGTSDCEPVLFWQGGWHVQCSGKEGYDMTSASVAAMLMWLKINEKGEK